MKKNGMELKDFLEMVTDNTEAALQFTFVFDIHLKNHLALTTGLFPLHVRHEPFIPIALFNFRRHCGRLRIEEKDFNPGWDEVFNALLLEAWVTEQYIHSSQEINLKQINIYEQAMQKANEIAEDKLYGDLQKKIFNKN